MASFDENESFDDVDRRIRSTHPEVGALWDKSAQRRGLSEFLLRARYRADLSQSQLAKRAGWDKSFVSRLESAFSPVPDLVTIARYIAACGESVGLTAFNSKEGSIVDAAPLDPPRSKQVELQKVRLETRG